MGVDDFEEEVELEDIELMDVSLVAKDMLPPASLVGEAGDLAPPEHAVLISEGVAPFPGHSRGTGSTREVVFAVGGKEIGIERDGGGTATTRGLQTAYTAAIVPLHTIAIATAVPDARLRPVVAVVRATLVIDGNGGDGKQGAKHGDHSYGPRRVS
ncbi:hypothetical protein IW261DRAFT_1424414 [Armillaria novae-zelandiae]|uniref:Uncharacterized protein n=1 Tax=Armillaria novae-zelandiae TaxID=153914 RepID=A0AA39NV12_9AGAR|nr:hypothetical protein IW261DRAFT_1424414 [Armillaria novae-zelandiae]